MGKASRDKGARTERAIVKLLQDAGRAAERIPLSGAAGGRFSGDISVPVLGDDWTLEVKCRADGFRELYKWLSDHQALILKADRQEPLVVLTLKRATDILSKVESIPARLSTKVRVA